MRGPGTQVTSGTLEVVATRAGRVESRHRVHTAVVDADGTTVASAHDPELETYWRSAAKPLQALPLLETGAAEAFGFGTDALALACASHASEPQHLEIAAAMLRASGQDEDQLACGPHAPILGPGVQVTPAQQAQLGRRLASNCSGKHAAMLALARHLGADVAGYERAEHPVQQRILDAVCRSTGLPRGQIGLAGDGCRAVTFHLPLTAMARAWARFGQSPDPAMGRLRDAMWAHPQLLAGTGRSCSDLLQAGRDSLLVKIGAEGVYCAALPRVGLGIALKVESGDMRAAPVALVAVLEQLAARAPGAAGLAWLADRPIAWSRWCQPAIVDTADEQVGTIEARGSLRH